MDADFGIDSGTRAGATAGVTVKSEPNADYHADTSSVTKTMLTVFLRDKAEFYRRYVACTEPAPKQTKPKKIGDVSHAALLEPDRYRDQVLQAPSWALSKSGRRAGKLWKAFAAENKGKYLLTAKELKLVELIVAEARKVAGVLFDTPGIIEKSIYWTDEETGLPMKCRPDKFIVAPSMALIPDVKTARDASNRGFNAAIEEYAYWLQVTHYSAGVARYTGKPTHFVFVVIQNRPPIKAVLYQLEPPDLLSATNRYRQTLKDLATCYETGVWDTKQQPSEPKQERLTEVYRNDYSESIW